MQCKTSSCLSAVSVPLAALMSQRESGLWGVGLALPGDYIPSGCCVSPRGLRCPWALHSWVGKSLATENHRQRGHTHAPVLCWPAAEAYRDRPGLGLSGAALGVSCLPQSRETGPLYPGLTRGLVCTREGGSPLFLPGPSQGQLQSGMAAGLTETAVVSIFLPLAWVRSGGTG